MCMTWLRGRCGGERGSIPMALLAIMMMSAIIGVTAANVIAGEKQSQFDDSYERALQVAEVGADRIAAIVEANVAPPASATGTVGSGTYTVTSAGDVNGWTITSIGQVVLANRTQPIRRRVVVRIQRPRIFQHGLFGDASVHATGSSRRMISYDSLTGAASYSGEAPPGNRSTLASNAAVHAAGSVNGGTLVYPPEERFDVSSDAAVAFITRSMAACDAAAQTKQALYPGAGVTNPLVQLGEPLVPSVWRPDPWSDNQGFYCVDNLDFPANTTTLVQNATAANPVKIFVRNRVTFGRNAVVNCGTGCIAGEDAPNAAALQIYTSTSTLVSFAKDVRFAGSLYAPRAQCSGGAHLTVFGAMVCRVVGEFTGHFRLYYDQQLSTVVGARFRRWSEEPL